MVLLYGSSELDNLHGERFNKTSLSSIANKETSRNEEWKKSIRETVEKAISSKVEERLDTPPLERMRKKQMEAKMRKEQQMKELERNMNLSTPNGSSSSSSVSDSWKRKFAKSDDHTDASGDPRYYSYDLSALKKIDRYKFPHGISATVLAEQSTPSENSTLQGATTIILPSAISSSQFKVTTGFRNDKRSESRGTDNEGDTFSSSSYETKRRLFRKFSKEGFKDAVRHGSLFAVDKRGLYTDDIGTVLSADGPFWPNGLGPLVKTPKHIDGLPLHMEPLAPTQGEGKQQQGSSSGCGTTNRTTATALAESVSKGPNNAGNVQYPTTWDEEPILIYDSSRFVTHPVPHELPAGCLPSLVFESRFESGNLALAFRTGPAAYELILKADLFTDRHTQWFYFRVSGMMAGETYIFKIINLSKPDSLYNQGMRPLMYSEILADGKDIGWHRSGHHISYSTKTESKCFKYCRGLGNTSPVCLEQSTFAVLQWRVEFPHTADTCYFSHCYPYTFSKLRDFVNSIAEKTLNEKIFRKESLCETRARNTCYLLTITNQTVLDSEKRGVIVSARVHPGETNSSWMMHGFLEFIISDNPIAQRLRDKFIFKVVPMLNPDGVIVGNYRCSLFGKDLNRNYRKPRREYFPTIWATKQMLERFAQRCEVVLYVDMHGHSRKQNIFMYGCDSMYREDTSSISPATSCASPAEGFLNERLFPFLMSLKVSDKFSFRGCRFHIRKCKESTGRVVMFRQFNILNSFTMEATFCGTTLNGTSRHFTSDDFKSAGKALVQSLHDYARAMEDESAQSEYILELTRVVAADYLMDVPGRTNASNSENQSKSGSAKNEAFLQLETAQINEDEAFNRDILKRQQKLEELSEQLSRSKNLKECFKLLDSLRASAQGREPADSSDDSDSESDSEFLGDKKKKQGKDVKKKKPSKLQHNGPLTTQQRQPPASGTPAVRSNQPLKIVAKDSNVGPTADEWSKASINKPSLNVAYTTEVGTTRPNTSVQFPAKTANGTLRKSYHNKVPRALSTSLTHWRRHRFNIDASYPLNHHIPVSEYESKVDNYSSVICRLLDNVSCGGVNRPYTVAGEVIRRKKLIMSALEATRMTNKDDRININRLNLFDKVGGSSSTPLGVIGDSVGARAGAVISEYSNSVFNSKAAPPLVPAKVMIRGGPETSAAVVSRSSALNPYATRNGKGLPIFSEERSKEKKMKEVPSITSWPTQNLEQAVWGSKIADSSTNHLKEPKTSQSKSTPESHSRVPEIGIADQPVSSDSKLEYISSVKAIPTCSYRPQYIVSEKKVERVVPTKPSKWQTPPSASVPRPSPHLSLVKKQSDTRRIPCNQRTELLNATPSSTVQSSFSRNETHSNNSSVPENERITSLPSGRNHSLNSKGSTLEKKSFESNDMKHSTVPQSVNLELSTTANNNSHQPKESAKKIESRKKMNKSNFKLKAKSPNAKTK